MRKIISCLLTTIFVAGVFSACGNSHQFEFDQKVISDQYLSAEATCRNPALYYYSCKCGKAGKETFSNGDALPHEFTAKVVDSKYEKKKATCTEEGEYYMSCIYCGQQSYKKTFKTEKSDNHIFDREVKDAKYLKEEATFETNAVYYKSCICGARGEETFLGDKLRVYTEEEKVQYQPMSLTVSLYDSENSV